MSEKIKIDIDPYGKVITINGIEISFFILETIINTDDRALYRFSREGDTLKLRALTEKQVIWIDESEAEPES